MFSIFKRFFIYLNVLNLNRSDIEMQVEKASTQNTRSLHNCKMIRIWVNGKFMYAPWVKHKRRINKEKKIRIKIPKSRYQNTQNSFVLVLPLPTVLIYDFSSILCVDIFSPFNLNHRFSRNYLFTLAFFRFLLFRLNCAPVSVVDKRITAWIHMLDKNSISIDLAISLARHHNWCVR